MPDEVSAEQHREAWVRLFDEHPSGIILAVTSEYLTICVRQAYIGDGEWVEPTAAVSPALLRASNEMQHLLSGELLRRLRGDRLIRNPGEIAASIIEAAANFKVSTLGSEVMEMVVNRFQDDD